MALTRGELLVRGAAAALGLTRAGAAVAAAGPPRFRSRPDLDPPRVHVITAPDMTAPGVVSCVCDGQHGAARRRRELRRLGLGAPLLGVPIGRVASLRRRLSRRRFHDRAFRRSWTGTPVERPAFVVAGGAGYAGWNGATALTHWRLRAGPKPDLLTASHVVASRSFETKLALPRATRFAAVEALDRKGHVLGRSAVVRA